jgi:hypothetical protein
VSGTSLGARHLQHYKVSRHYLQHTMGTKIAINEIFWTQDFSAVRLPTQYNFLYHQELYRMHLFRTILTTNKHSPKQTRETNMVMIPVGLGTKSDSAGEHQQQQFTRPDRISKPRLTLLARASSSFRDCTRNQDWLCWQRSAAFYPTDRESWDRKTSWRVPRTRSQE